MRFETARFVGRVQKIVSGSGLWVRFRYLEHVVHEASTYIVPSRQLHIYIGNSMFKCFWFKCFCLVAASCFLRAVEATSVAMETPPHDRKRKRKESAPDEVYKRMWENRGKGTKEMCV